MPTLDELLQAKQARLESVPGKFASELTRIQKQLIVEVQDLLARFDIDASGNFVISEANMELAAEMDILLRQVLDRSEYADAVTDFARQFNTQIDFNNAYFTRAFKGFEQSEIGVMVVRQAQKNAVDLLINTSLDSEFILPIKQQIEQAIITGARYRETIDTLRTITVGDEQLDGKLLSYGKQIAHDTFAVSDRSYAAAVADQMDATWFKYSGGIIATSRPFCIERHGKFFCKKEIELWGEGEKTPDFEWPQNKTWAGKGLGTDGQTIFSWAGGYWCGHSIMAVSIFLVPIDDIRRAINLGYYTPTKFEKEQLGV